ncbi:hypothetical protein ACWGKS_29030 [Nocardiopsis sp. NPDC055879]
MTSEEGALLVAIISASIALLSMGGAGWAAWAAHRSAEEAKAANSLENARRHDELHPAMPEKLEAFPRESRIQDKVEVFVTLQLPRTYWVQAAVLGINSERTIINETLSAGTSRDLHLATLGTGIALGVEAIKLRIWPPAGTNTWTCPCGRPATPEEEPSGHWSMTLPITYQPPPAGPFMFQM